MAHISTNFVHEGGLSRGGSVHVLEPHQKSETAPHQLFSCSFSPLLRPRSSARLFIYPSACFAFSRFQLAFSARSSSLLLRAPSRPLRALAFSIRPDPVRRMVPSVRPSTRPFTMPQPRFALSRFRLPRVGFLSRSFGSLEPVSRRCPYIYLARVPRPLLRHPL